MRRRINSGLFVALVAILLVLLIPLYMIAVTYHSLYASVDAVPTSPVALVLGASVSANGTLSPVVRERADTAVALYKAHKVQKVLVTGDDGSVAYNEVYPIGKYIVAAGVPKASIFLDYAGFDTYSSLYRAQAVFGVTSLTIVSQRFHLPRALYVAERLGLTAYGVDASGPGEQYLYNALREILASDKALVDLMRGRVPKYLGAPFPITGDGSATWLAGTSSQQYFSPR